MLFYDKIGSQIAGVQMQFITKRKVFNYLKIYLNTLSESCTIVFGYINQFNYGMKQSVD